MRKNILWMCLFLTGSAFLLLRCSAPGETNGPLEGKVAPAFELRSIDGKMVSLTQLKGKIVVLDFWATWCGPCRISMPIVERVQKEFGSEVVLLAINLEEPLDVVRNYASRENLRSIILMDEEGSVGRAYKVVSIPMHILIDQEGIIQQSQVGVSPLLESRLRDEINRLRRAG